MKFEIAFIEETQRNRNKKRSSELQFNVRTFTWIHFRERN